VQTHLYDVMVQVNLLARGKSGQTIFKYVNPEWVVAADIDIHSHVKLAVVDEVGSS